MLYLEKEYLPHNSVWSIYYTDKKKVRFYVKNIHPNFRHYGYFYSPQLQKSSKMGLYFLKKPWVPHTCWMIKFETVMRSIKSTKEWVWQWRPLQRKLHKVSTTFRFCEVLGYEFYWSLDYHILGYIPTFNFFDYL